VEFDEARERLVLMARENGGVLTAELAEHDRLLAADPNVVAAAARSLDGTTNIFGTPRTGEGWFPFDELRFTAL
jgi:hypothetical protein